MVEIDEIMGKNQYLTDDVYMGYIDEILISVIFWVSTNLSLFQINSQNILIGTSLKRLNQTNPMPHIKFLLED